MSFKHDDRLIRLKNGPIPPDEMLFTAFSGQESISRLFSFQLEFVSTNLDLTAKDLIGKDLTIEIDRRDGEGEAEDPRIFHGYINQLAAGNVVLHETDNYKYRYYRAEMVPWLWFLTQAARCYAFFPEKEDKTVYEIIEAVFDRAKEDFHIKPETDLSGIAELKNRKLKHCVQYRETDFNFLSRMLEQYGAHYHFKHEDKKHTLVLSTKKNYPKCVEAEVSYPRATGAQGQDDHITSWEHNYEFKSGKFEHTDYDFTKPLSSLKSTSTSITLENSESEKYEIYDYPGEFEEKANGGTEARIRQEEEESGHNVVTAGSVCRTLTAGHTFKLKDHPEGDVVSEHKKSYLITSIQHVATQPGADGEGGAADYSNTFSCIPDSVQFRPARITPKPVVSGIHTAVVVGPDKEEIHTDEFGRVKVCFHWDREEERQKKNGEKFFCWVRVAQNIAGRKWGFMAIPRIGQEVVVDFIEGDPDRPLIVGSVYNKDQMPHYKLPDDKTKTYIKTNSTKGGEGFNELCFDDKADDERLFMHAQKNMDVRVLNDSKARIYGHRHQIIGWEKDGDKGGDQREMVWQDKHLNIKRHQVEHIEGNAKLMIGKGDADDGGNLDIVIEKDKKELVEANVHQHIKADRFNLVDGSQAQTIKGDHLEKVDGGQSLEVGGQLVEKVGADQSLSVGGVRKSEISGADHLKVGDAHNVDIAKGHSIKVGADQQMKVAKKHAVDAGQEIHLKAGMKVIIEAGMQISLKGPGGFVDIGPAGVTIQGTMVKINSGGAAGAGSGASPEAPKPPEAPKAPAEPEDAKEAAPTKPALAHNSKTGMKSSKG